MSFTAIKLFTSHVNILRKTVCTLFLVIIFFTENWNLILKWILYILICLRDWKHSINNLWMIHNCITNKMALPDGRFIYYKSCMNCLPGLEPDSAEEEPLLESLLRLLLWFRWRCFRCRLWCRLCLQCSSPPLHRCFFLCFFSPTVRPFSPVAEASKRFSFSRLLFLRRFLSRPLLMLLFRSLGWNMMTTKWKVQLRYIFFVICKPNIPYLFKLVPHVTGISNIHCTKKSIKQGE